MTDQLRDQLQASLGTSYTLERELGGGGMSRVFVAEETRLGRHVVVKLLSPELAKGVSADRFEREIRLVAALQQANIVPLLNAGDSDGLPYYTMPLVEGLSLRARLTRNGAMPTAEATSVLRDVARALAYAHEHGVVHRDIKPENILLSGDAAVVTDFGIAKALSASRTQAPGGTLTQVGTSIGTPAYMAPEQAAGDPDTDHRADLYALGCVAYEMLTGAPPFAGRPVHQLFAAHMNEKPASLATARRDVSPGLAALVMRCLEKEPSRRPQSAREVLQALDTVTSGSGSAAVRRTSPRLITAMAAVIVLLASGAGWMMHGRGAATDAAVTSVAVLPFENASGDTASNYFADGMTDELATALARVPGLRVASRTSSYTFRNRAGTDVRTVATKLGVGAVVEGTVRRAGNQLRITAQLTRASDGQSLWADAFTAGAGDVFAVQERLTQAIVAAVAPALSGRAITATAAAGGTMAGTNDTQAYDAYLRARYELNRRGPGVRRSIALFQEAIRRDSSFAQAWAGLAFAWAILSDYDVTADPSLSVDSVRVAAARATKLDSLAGEPWSALGYAFSIMGDHDRAEPLLRRGVELEPRQTVARRALGLMYTRAGRYDDAVKQQRAAVALDPLSAVSTGNLAILLAARHATRDEGRALARRAVALDPMNAGAMNNPAVALVLSGDFQESLDLVRTVRFDSTVYRVKRSGIVDYAALGQLDSVRAIVAFAERQPRTVQNLETLAVGAAALGQWDRFFSLAESAVAKDRRLDFIENAAPLFRPLLDDPRLEALCVRARYPCETVRTTLREAVPLRFPLHRLP